MIPSPNTHPCAASIFGRFCDFRHRFDQITERAPSRFVQQQWQQLREDSGARQTLYKTAIDRAESDVRGQLGPASGDKQEWSAIKKNYTQLAASRLDPELAQTFFNSVTRRIFGTVGVDETVEFIKQDHEQASRFQSSPRFRRYPLADNRKTAITRLLCDFEETALDRSQLASDLTGIVEKIEDRLHRHPIKEASWQAEMFHRAFYRGQGAYLIGRIVAGDLVVPLVFALLHTAQGIVVDAVVMDGDGVSIVFSYTRSAFHVLVEQPREVIDFLLTIMPAKPEAELYSAIGYFKHGKTVLYRDLCRHTAECSDAPFSLSPGKRGMVMLVFDIVGHDMVVKLIRDRFDNPKKTTRARVMGQYDFVFNHYRVGRLIEAHTFEQLSFDRCWFPDDLLDTLLREAGRSVRIAEDRVILAHAYLERRVTPLDIHLKEATGEQAARAVVDFGNAIKDMAYANIFPGDVLLKNFGVTQHGRVVFYDYDEIVPLTDCRFRAIPQARSEMEEMASEPWYTVEENDVFPEELSRFLGLSPEHRRLFYQHHADLFDPRFWIDIQKEIHSGRLRHIRPYRTKYRVKPGK